MLGKMCGHKSSACTASTPMCVFEAGERVSAKPWVCLLLVVAASCQGELRGGDRGDQVKARPAADKDWSQGSLTLNEW